MRVAVAQYDLQRPSDWSSYCTRIGSWIEEAAYGGAELAVFPEYAGLELAGLASTRRRVTPRNAFGAMQEFVPAALAWYRELARYYGMTIVAGSLPVGGDEDGFHNRVHVVGADGTTGVQDKLLLTRVERSTGVMTPGGQLRVFGLGTVRIGITLCYDCQFPLLGNAMARAGADVLIAPSCTHAATGFNRVRIGSRARAIENQCLTVQAPLVGDVDWLPLMATNHGRAGVFSPPDDGFPEDGVIAEGADQSPGWLWVDLDIEAARRLRAEGQVGNYDDWPHQHGVVAEAVERVTLAPGGGE